MRRPRLVAIARDVAVAVTLILAVAKAASATPILTVTGVRDSYENLAISSARGVGFSIASTYYNVEVAIYLTAFQLASSSTTASLSSFLTTQYGAGTTAASHEIASASTMVTVPNSPSSDPATWVINPYTVITVPVLTAGTYYLTLVGTTVPQSVYWLRTGSGAQTIVSAGATLAENFLFAGVPASYVPASPFNSTMSPYMWFRVSGDTQPTNGAPVPEPASLLLVGAGFAAAGCRRYRARRP
jgi:hypothetical protein